MTRFSENRDPARLKTALLLGGGVMLLTAFGGWVLFLAGTLVLGMTLSASYPELVAGLLARGPLGHATWMTLLMAAGAPFVGAGVAAVYFVSRR